MREPNHKDLVNSIRNPWRFHFASVVVLASLFGLQVKADPRFKVALEQPMIAFGDFTVARLLFTNIPMPENVELPKVKSLEFRRLSGYSSSIKFIDGRRTVTHIFRVQIRPLSEGEFKIPSFSVEIDGETIRSRPVTLTVKEKGFLTLGEILKTPYGPHAKFEFSLDRKKIQLGGFAVATLKFFDMSPKGDLDMPIMDSLKFELKGGTKPRMTIVDGRQIKTQEIKLRVHPTAVGKFTIPAISVRSGNKVFRSQPVTLEVEKAKT